MVQDDTSITPLLLSHHKPIQSQLVQGEVEVLQVQTERLVMLLYFHLLPQTVDDMVRGQIYQLQLMDEMVEVVVVVLDTQEVQVQEVQLHKALQVELLIQVDDELDEVVVVVQYDKTDNSLQTQVMGVLVHQIQYLGQQLLMQDEVDEVHQNLQRMVLVVQVVVVQVVRQVLQVQ